MIACDQHTSEPEYWQRVTGWWDAPSTLRLILPESRLSGDRVDQEIQEINVTMRSYLAEGLFDELDSALLYVERTLDNGTVRRGLVGAVDLEKYDYRTGAAGLIRATEGTVLPHPAPGRRPPECRPGNASCDAADRRPGKDRPGAVGGSEGGDGAAV